MVKDVSAGAGCSHVANVLPCSKCAKLHQPVSQPPGLNLPPTPQNLPPTHSPPVQVFLREAKRTRLDSGGGGFVTDNEWVLDTEGEHGCCPAGNSSAWCCPGFWIDVPRTLR